MVYQPQRRHVVHSIGETIQALAVVQHFYHPNILVLLARLLVQLQISGAPILHPERSLMALFVMVTLMNSTGALLHCLDFVGGGDGGKGLVLDFVGQANPASLTRVLVLDAVLFTFQVISLVITFINGHGGKLEQSSLFPYDDLLLPSAPEPELEPRGNVDPESGGVGWRKGKGRADEEEIWLDDEEDELLPAGSSRGPNGRRLREPPLIFSLSLPYLLKLLFRLPSPPPAPRAFSGGTPLHQSPNLSPVDTPSRPGPLLFGNTNLTRESDASPAASDAADAGLPTDTPRTRQSTDARSDSESEGQSDRSGAPRARSTQDEEEGGRPGQGRLGGMPGGYWVSRGR